jgi:hypothetical protein
MVYLWKAAGEAGLREDGASGDRAALNLVLALLIATAI